MTGPKQGFNIVDQLAVLRRYARSLVRNADDAEDLVHDTLVRAYEKKATFRPGANVRSWLMSILHNTHIDRLRRRKSLDRRHDAAAEIAIPALAANQELAVRLAQVQAAFFELPDDQREALHLVSIEEMTYQEAADTLNIPVGTLMSRISRARARLRMLEESEQRGGPRLRLVGGSDDE